MKQFIGVRSPDGVLTVYVKTAGGRHLLGLYLHIRNHSPDGHEAGYNGSGPAQLALSILMNVLRDRQQAETAYQDFKRDVIATLPADPAYELGSDLEEWRIDETYVRAWFAAWQQNERGRGLR